MVPEILQHLSSVEFLVLACSLGLVFAFEAVNGFHDTANAVATVIYTNSLRPTTAVFWSGLCNMAGILLGGIGVAFSIVHLLPVDLLVHVNTNLGLAMVLSLLISSLLWNLGTWFLGLPASSSHALIGSILGVGIANSVLSGHGVSNGVNLGKIGEVGFSLLLSPVLGFGLSALALFILGRSKAKRVLSQTPSGGKPPPFWVRATLCLSCTGVSFAHGSNDGQKGMGLVMLILIGLLPAQFALNLENEKQVGLVLDSAVRLEVMIDRAIAVNVPSSHSQFGQLKRVSFSPPNPEYISTRNQLRNIIQKIQGKSTFSDLASEDRWQLRQDFLRLDSSLQQIDGPSFSTQADNNAQSFRELRTTLRNSIEYVPTWVILSVAIALGFGTMFGWKRVVVTVGEKIGKSHLTYGQGASAELIAMATIGLGNIAGLPVSTTHVLSSGIAGTMWANRSGINGSTVKNILIAWILTLPATMLLSGLLFYVAKLVIA